MPASAYFAIVSLIVSGLALWFARICKEGKLNSTWPIFLIVCGGLGFWYRTQVEEVIEHAFDFPGKSTQPTPADFEELVQNAPLPALATYNYEHSRIKLEPETEAEKERRLAAEALQRITAESERKKRFKAETFERVEAEVRAHAILQTRAQEIQRAQRAKEHQWQEDAEKKKQESLKRRRFEKWRKKHRKGEGANAYDAALTAAALEHGHPVDLHKLDSEMEHAESAAWLLDLDEKEQAQKNEYLNTTLELLKGDMSRFDPSNVPGVYIEYFAVHVPRMWDAAKASGPYAKEAKEVLKKLLTYPTPEPENVSKHQEEIRAKAESWLKEANKEIEAKSNE